MQVVRSLLFALLFYSATAILAVVGLAASVFGTRPARSVVLFWADLHHWLTDRVLGIRLEVEGTVPSGPVLIAVKHQSMYETIEIVRLANTPVIVLKRELTRIPLFGWMTRRYGVIPVDRGAGAKALRELIVLGRAAVADQRQVIIYPEGTRVPPGRTPPLRPGFAGLYRALGMPVVPVAVDSGRLWGRGLIKRSGTVRFLVGQPIEAGLDRREIEQRVHAAINALELGP
ncbi:MAG TPA: lysophospholipid acyltransferase family protein [Sphingomicrobium sp.]|jgi:1-acyl-sn-glycerol-3-phosphate acyltransferase|nr:lysophospholipid acyltransferase family protein [Sphingomicrobium sp.]